jgi:hypothetical protein
MGWNSWNAFYCDINEALIKEVARAIVDSGLRDAGYQVSPPKGRRKQLAERVDVCVMHACVAQYVNLDDCWMEARDNLTGHILPFADKFPSGMKALGDYIHSLGLKFGVYSGAGSWHTPHTTNPAAPRTPAKHHAQATRRVRTGQAPKATRSRMRSTTRRGASTMSSMTSAAWRVPRSSRATVRC